MKSLLKIPTAILIGSAFYETILIKSFHMISPLLSKLENLDFIAR
tara:strand:+ start:313 stop:447 length:135 start_codon:yes stop_codon:yes gene_type:complete